MLEPGDPAPAIALSDQHGDAVTVDPPRRATRSSTSTPRRHAGMYDRGL